MQSYNHIFVRLFTRVAVVGVVTEEVRHGDITTRVKCVWNVIAVDKYSFFQS